MATRTKTERDVAERGSVSVMFMCILAFAILPIVGLAIDGSVAFIVTTRLSATIDAAALAAARSLNVGLDITSQRQSAIETAQAYFSANFPNGFLGATASMDPPQVVQNSSAVRTVTVSGSANSPLFFLRLLGGTSATVRAQGQASRRDANIMLLLDRSGSMYDSGSCDPMKTAAQSFVNLFANQRDRVGLITFLGSANVDFAQSLNFKPGLANTIQKLNCAGNTGTAQALSLAHGQFLDTNKKLLYPGAQNVILLFTDGQPNGVSGSFPLKGTCTSPTGTLDGFLAGSGSSPVGVYSALGVSLSTTNVPLQMPPSAAGCKFQPGNASKVTSDVSEIPPEDLYQNHTHGYKTTVSSGPIPVTGNMVGATSWNSADDAAYSIRKDGILIYCIGESRDVDSVFLKRVANTPDSTSYDSKLPVGKYIYAPDGGQIAAAFNAIASQILYLSQ